MHIKLLTFCFVTLLMVFSGPLFAEDENPHEPQGIGEIRQGGIVAINLEEHLITIDNKVYELDDKLIIIAPNKMMASRLALQPDQQIQFWAYPQNKKAAPNGPALPPYIVSKIQIITGFNPNVFKQ